METTLKFVRPGVVKGLGGEVCFISFGLLGSFKGKSTSFIHCIQHASTINVSLFPKRPARSDKKDILAHTHLPYSTPAAFECFLQELARAKRFAAGSFFVELFILDHLNPRHRKPAR